MTVVGGTKREWLAVGAAALAISAGLPVAAQAQKAPENLLPPEVKPAPVPAGGDEVTASAQRAETAATVQPVVPDIQVWSLADARALAAVVACIVAGKALGGLLVVAVLATTWSMFFRPLHRRRYRESLADLPTWQIEPD